MGGGTIQYKDPGLIAASRPGGRAEAGLRGLGLSLSSRLLLLP